MTSAPPIAFLNARLIDPVQETETRGGLIVIEGVIAGVGAKVTRDQLPAEARIVDCAGDVVSPGLVDMRAFVGEPGAEHRETIASASAAAAAGGVTTLITRPDTNPPVDDPAVVDFILRRARDAAKVRIHPAAALTKGLKGDEIAEIGLLAEAGAIAFCDGTHSVVDALTMRRAMTYARDFDALIAPICEGRDLARPPRRAARSGNHWARPRSALGRADRRSLSRGADLESSVARGDCASTRRWAAGNLRRVDQSPDLERVRRRRLSYVSQTQTPAARRGRALGAGRGPGRRPDRRHLLRPRSPGRRYEAAAVRGSGGGRYWNRNNAVGEPAPGCGRTCLATAPHPRDDFATCRDPAPAGRQAVSRRASRHHPL